MRQTTKTAEMSMFPLFVIGTTMLGILLYFVAAEALSSKPRGAQVYLPSAYGVNELSWPRSL